MSIAASMPGTLNFRTLDLNLLRVFDVVMAERLSITQPAVSNALKRLKAIRWRSMN